MKLPPNQQQLLINIIICWPETPRRGFKIQKNAAKCYENPFTLKETLWVQCEEPIIMVDDLKDWMDPVNTCI